MNGGSLRVDGTTVNPPDHWSYQALMLSDVPNLVLTFGYVDASWTPFVAQALSHPLERRPGEVTSV